MLGLGKLNFVSVLQNMSYFSLFFPQFDKDGPIIVFPPFIYIWKGENEYSKKRKHTELQSAPNNLLMLRGIEIFPGFMLPPRSQEFVLLCWTYLLFLYKFCKAVIIVQNTITTFSFSKLMEVKWGKHCKKARLQLYLGHYVWPCTLKLLEEKRMTCFNLHVQVATFWIRLVNKSYNL